MRISFRQGIVQAEQQPLFLQVTPQYVSLLVQNTPFVATVSAGTKDYLVVQKSTIQNAWGPLVLGQTTYLYLDIDVRTAAVTFGSSTLAPVVSADAPVQPANGLHWYDTATRTMKVWAGAAWQPKNRLFICLLDNGSVPTSLTSNSDFTGTQVGDNSSIFAGQIVFDNSGGVLKDSSGKFVTTEDQLRTQVASGTGIRLSALVSEAEAVDNLPAYSVVKYVDFGFITRADAFTASQLTQFGIIEAPAIKGETVSVITSGRITNASWDWTPVGVNAPLYCDATGLLTPTPVIPNQVPVAIIIDTDTIQLGTPRVTVNPTQTNTSIVQADTMSDTIPGIARLNIPAATPGSPVVVGANDPRLTDARTPLAHVHSTSDVTGLNQALAEVLNVSGGTLTGPLVLSADPVVALGAATKQYVDAKTVPGLPIAGGTMTGPLYLAGDPTNSVGAATKQYVDARILRSGDTMSGPLTLHNDPAAALDAATKQYVDTRLLRTGDTMSGYLVLNADPVISLGAATKQYVDALHNLSFPRSGGSLTGPLTLYNNPTAPLDAATKQYVDTQLATVNVSVRSINNKTGIVTLLASDITIADVNNRYTSTNVEDALQEVALTASNLQSAVNTLQTTGSTTASNLGTGLGLFTAKSGSALQFKSLVAGANVSFTTDANTITITGAAPGEVNTGATLGTGTAIYASKVGSVLQFNSLVAGTNISLASSLGNITISGASYSGSNLGTGNGVYASTSGTQLQFKTLIAGSNITLTPTANDITIASTAVASGSSLGAGTQIFAGSSGSTLQFNTIAAGTGITISGPTAGVVTISAPTAGGGTISSGTNLGTGTGVFAAASGSALQFNSLAAGSGVTISGPTSGTITISATGTVSGASNLGTGSGVYSALSSGTLQFNSIVAGTGVSVSAPSAGNITVASTMTGSSLGTGTAVYSATSGNTLQFNSLAAGSGVTISGPTSGVITISATGGSGTVTGASNLGTGTGVYSSLSGSTLQFKTLVAGTNISLANDANTVTITASGSVTPTVTFNRQIANYTLALSDCNGSTMVEMNVATANTLTVPPNSSVAVTIGSSVNFSQYGAGQTTIVAGSGVTLRYASSLTTRAQYSIGALVKVGTDEWYVYGDMT